MKLTDDLKSPWMIHLKGALFVFLALLCAGLLFLESPTLRTAGLIVLLIWASCRFYYYLFYVLDRYLGRDRRFSGIGDALKFLLSRKKR